LDSYRKIRGGPGAIIFMVAKRRVDLAAKREAHKLLFRIPKVVLPVSLL